MAGLNQRFIDSLRSRVRDFEDQKVTGSVLSLEIFHLASNVNGDDESILKRYIETKANRVATLADLGLSQNVRPQILEVIDALESELRDWGY